MKPQLLRVSMNLAQSFSARQDTVPYINNRWHYHAEVELIYFKRGNGTQFIGDSIKRFRSGDLVLVGAHLPHYWRFDDEYFEENSNVSADVRVIHFCENFWGEHFLDLPENKLIKTTLEKARRGIQIGDKIKTSVGEILNDIIHTEGPKKIILLMGALMTIGNSCVLKTSRKLPRGLGYGLARCGSEEW